MDPTCRATLSSNGVQLVGDATIGDVWIKFGVPNPGRVQVAVLVRQALLRLGARLF